MEDAVKYLTELRKRLIWSLCLTGAVFFIASFYANKIYYVLTLPLLHHLTQDFALIATAVPAPFLIPVKSAFIASFYLTVPFWLYQLWSFVAPALYQHERKLVWLLVLTSAVLFYLGTFFAYWVILPALFKFFISIAPHGVEVKPDISQYFNFITKIFFSFSLSFELPVAMVLLVWLNICSLTTLVEKRPYAIVGAFIVALLLTPPDVISQILLAIPLWLLYELGLLLCRLLKVSTQDVING